MGEGWLWLGRPLTTSQVSSKELRKEHLSQNFRAERDINRTVISMIYRNEEGARNLWTCQSTCSCQVWTRF